MAQTNRSTPMLLLRSKLKKKLRSEVTAINQSQVNSSPTIGCCEENMLQCCQLWRRKLFSSVELIFHLHNFTNIMIANGHHAFM